VPSHAKLVSLSSRLDLTRNVSSHFVAPALGMESIPLESCQMVVFICRIVPYLIQLPVILAELLAGPCVGAVAGLLGAFLT